MPFIPEIVSGDPLYNLIVDLVVKHKPKTILEIGSANGRGSTKAFIEGIHEAKLQDHCIMFCLEAKLDRYNELIREVKDHSFIKCVWASSIPIDEYMTEKQIELFMQSHGYDYNIKRHSTGTVKQWRKSEINEIISNGVAQDGLFYVLDRVDKKPFDMVLIDGSAFTAMKEYEIVNGAGIIIMDDTKDIKCDLPHRLIQKTGCYEIIEDSGNYRNGFAAFRRKI
jgi:hypothetical protein